jgi:predicted transcriptional regulator
VEDFMTPCAHSVSTVATLAEVELEMATRGVSALVVVTGEGKPVGVISRTDILRSGLRREPGQQGARLSERRAAVDTYHGQLLSISRFARLREATDMLLDNRVHRLLVTQGSEIVGVLSLTDLLHVVAAGPRQVAIGPLASEGIVGIPAAMPVSRAIDELASSGVHGLAVLDDGVVVGTFTQREAVEAAARARPGATVDHWMDRTVIAMGADAGISRAAREIVTTDTTMIFVLDDHGGRRGVVTASDLVGALR